MSEENKEIALTPVESSNIDSIGFCPDRKCIAVKFKNGGLYHYPDCTQEMFDDLKSAKSVGQHFAANLKGRSFTKM